MKILLIQLARLGDIYLTWPAVRALRKKYPNAEIHYLTRSRFVSALEGLDEIDRIHILPSREILGPVIATPHKSGVDESVQRMGMFVDRLVAEQYTWIVNWSFSPASSYLVDAVAEKTTKISGYTRHEDGFLAIPDDMSAYFYAQVGPNRSNRFHLAEIFATLVECDLELSDWTSGKENSNKEWDLAVHVGASENHKSISPQKWVTILARVLQNNPQAKICLLGSAEEIAKASHIESSVAVKNLVGQTKLPQLFEIIGSAKTLIAPDSALIHIASLTNTPTLNLSVGNVNYWETGARAEKSIILRAENEDGLVSDEVVSVLSVMKQGANVATALPEPMHQNIIECIAGAPAYQPMVTSESSELRWHLIKAIYLGEAFPLGPNIFHHAALQLAEINRVILEQIQSLINGVDVQKMSGLIDRGDEVIVKIAELVPDISPLICWLRTEKSRIGPGTLEEILQQTKSIHEKFAAVLELYEREGSHEHNDDGQTADRREMGGS